MKVYNAASRPKGRVGSPLRKKGAGRAKKEHLQKKTNNIPGKKQQGPYYTKKKIDKKQVFYRTKRNQTIGGEAEDHHQTQLPPGNSP